MNSLWKRAAFGLFVLSVIGAILVVGYGPGPKVEREAMALQAQSDREWRERRDRALRSCYESGGVPALGFGFSVVCIEGCVREYDPEKGRTRSAGDYTPERCP